jgi:hypothetical protein
VAAVHEQRFAAFVLGRLAVDELVAGVPAAGEQHVEAVHDRARVDVVRDVGEAVVAVDRLDLGLHERGHERPAHVHGGLGERPAQAARRR